MDLSRSKKSNPTYLAPISIGIPILTLLVTVTQLVLVMPRWFEPNLVIPIT